jgi:hypothetical protein
MTAIHILRQQRQSLLHVVQDLALKAAPNFFQRVDKARQFVSRDLSVQGKPIEPCHLSPYPDKRIQGHLITRG